MKSLIALFFIMSCQSAITPQLSEHEYEMDIYEFCTIVQQATDCDTAQGLDAQEQNYRIFQINSSINNI